MTILGSNTWWAGAGHAFIGQDPRPIPRVKRVPVRVELSKEGLAIIDDVGLSFDGVDVSRYQNEDLFLLLLSERRGGDVMWWHRLPFRLGHGESFWMRASKMLFQ
jgi:hypothetical protein